VFLSKTTDLNFPKLSAECKANDYLFFNSKFSLKES